MVVGEIDEISAELRLLSRQTDTYGDAGMAVSHDRLMHLTMDRFVKQPRDEGAVRRRRRPTSALPRLR
jgi:hypothetical protein